MKVPLITLTKMTAARGESRLRWTQLSLRTLFLLLTATGVMALFHEPLAAWGKSAWQRWFPEPPPPAPPPTVKFFNCPGCGMG